VTVEDGVEWKIKKESEENIMASYAFARVTEHNSLYYVQYNTIFVYYELTERSSTRDTLLSVP